MKRTFQTIAKEKIVKKMTIALIVGVAFIAVAGPSEAHHSMTMFDPDKEVTFEGAVKELQYTKPPLLVTGRC